MNPYSTKETQDFQAASAFPPGKATLRATRAGCRCMACKVSAAGASPSCRSCLLAVDAAAGDAVNVPEESATRRASRPQQLLSVCAAAKICAASLNTSQVLTGAGYGTERGCKLLYYARALCLIAMVQNVLVWTGCGLAGLLPLLRLWLWLSVTCLPLIGFATDLPLTGLDTEAW